MLLIGSSFLPSSRSAKRSCWQLTSAKAVSVLVGFKVKGRPFPLYLTSSDDILLFDTPAASYSKPESREIGACATRILLESILGLGFCVARPRRLLLYRPLREGVTSRIIVLSGTVAVV